MLLIYLGSEFRTQLHWKSAGQCSTDKENEWEVGDRLLRKSNIIHKNSNNYWGKEKKKVCQCDEERANDSLIKNTNRIQVKIIYKLTERNSKNSLRKCVTDIYKLEIKSRSWVFSERYVKERKKWREDKRKKKKKKEKKKRKK